MAISGPVAPGAKFSRVDQYFIEVITWSKNTYSNAVLKILKENFCTNDITSAKS